MYWTALGMSPYRIVFDKACYLSVEIEHRAYWAVKQCNLAYDQAVELKDENRNSTFQVNRHPIKLFHEGPTMMVGEMETISLMEPVPPVGTPWASLTIPSYSCHTLRRMHHSSQAKDISAHQSRLSDHRSRVLTQEKSSRLDRLPLGPAHSTAQQPKGA
ncbi:hypothetical protein CR513_28970, partial [Mucuna pruriens]